MAGKVKEGKPIIFNSTKAVSLPCVISLNKTGNQKIKLTWDTAYAGDSPIACYENPEK